MAQWTETVELGGIKFEVTCEYSAYEPATHTDPAVNEEFYAISAMANGYDWLEHFSGETAEWLTEQVREKMA